MDCPGLRLLISRKAIAERVEALARDLNRSLGPGPLLAVCVLKGAALFHADLVRLLAADVQMDFLRVESYGRSMESCGQVRLTQDLETPVRGKRVLVVEDIVDTGRSLRFLLDELARRGAVGLTTCVLLDKPGRRQVEVAVDHVGFRIPDVFVVGYGMDLAERFRALDAIYEIVDSTAH